MNHASENERALEQAISERDAAEECLSQMYYLVTGRSPEWSNLFGHKEALEEIGDATAALKSDYGYSIEGQLPTAEGGGPAAGAEKAITPKDFAAMCRAALAVRETSWSDGNKRYMKSSGQAAMEACPETWVTIVACLLTSGYADVWEWCDKVEKK